MRLYVQAGQAGVEGKYSEHEKCMKVAMKLNELLDGYIALIDNSNEDDDETDITMTYDENDYTVKEVRDFYMLAKKQA